MERILYYHCGTCYGFIIVIADRASVSSFFWLVIHHKIKNYFVNFSNFLESAVYLLSTAVAGQLLVPLPTNSLREMVKKKLRTIPKKVKSEPLTASELPRPHESEDEEDYAVADLSAIPTPKIEFVMPNLTPLDGSKKETPKKVKVPEKTEKATLSSEASTLTPEQLNIEIVHLRPIVQKARRFLSHRLVRKMKGMEARLAKKENNALKRKVQRYEEEIHSLKTIKKDDVSKFALLNKKSLDELRITDKTPVRERCLYKLACEPPVIKAVQQYRNRYPSWEVTTAYLLQRLGAQYSSTKGMALESMPSDSEGSESSEEALEIPKKKSKISKVSTAKIKEKLSKSKKQPSLILQRSGEESLSDKSDAGGSSEEDGDGVSGGSGDDEPDVEIGSDSDDNEETAAHRRELLLGPASSVRMDKKKKKKEKPSLHKKRALAIKPELSEIKSPSTVKNSTSGVRTLKKKKAMLRESKAHELTTNATESVAPSTKGLEERKKSANISLNHRVRFSYFSALNKAIRHIACHVE
ncbi:hypothetical protein Y032_0008g312 [Ancylostoma ceylanicum]|uniref:Serum response factor-binding protein 1 n=1 Tax=Ancylostoma ceylanicum TaxID=53326 RepID=A0A016VMV2_9BILA|nr:hypothetical protein Y032_0008g312 [Ancylostoma ceylanicum]